MDYMVQQFQKKEKKNLRTDLRAMGKLKREVKKKNFFFFLCAKS